MKFTDFYQKKRFLGDFGALFLAYVRTFEGCGSEVGGPIGLKIFPEVLQVGGLVILIL